jgi:hypothetical protein
MNRALSLLISAGIVGFGIWIMAHAITAGSAVVWTLMGIPPVGVGLISLYQAITEARPA